MIRSRGFFYNHLTLYSFFCFKLNLSIMILLTSNLTSFLLSSKNVGKKNPERGTMLRRAPSHDFAISHDRGESSGGCVQLLNLAWGTQAKNGGK